MILYYYNNILVSRNKINFNINLIGYDFMWYNGIDKDGYIYVGFWKGKWIRNKSVANMQ